MVGANNVGKSSLLLCLAARFKGDPHKSIYTRPKRDDLLDPNSQVTFTFVVKWEELRRLLFNSGTDLPQFAWPNDVEFSDERTAEALDRLVKTNVYAVSRFSTG